MTGLPYWDAVIWAVVGVIGGAVLGRWSSPRAPLFVALFVALVGFLAVPLVFVVLGAEASPYAIMVVLWSVPMTLGLAIGAALSRLGRRD